jgi:hypothetical protein
MVTGIKNQMIGWRLCFSKEKSSNVILKKKIKDKRFYEGNDFSLLSLIVTKKGRIPATRTPLP